MRAMAEIHELILRYGVDQARDMARTKLQRAVVDAAAAIMAEEIEKLGISHAGFAMTSPPHKKIDGHVWRRDGGSVTLVVQSGTDKLGRELGVPYGAIARMILIYLQTQAIQTASRQVELGPSMRSWMIRMK